MNTISMLIPLFALMGRAVPGLAAGAPLPPPWQQQDIGAALVSGGADIAAGVFSVQGTQDLWGMTDGCHIVWQPLPGDAELVARVVAMENPGGVAHAKASLCLRESLAAGARHVSLCVTPTDGTQFLYRGQAGGKTVRVFAATNAPPRGVPPGQFPCWLKLVRHGPDFSGYASADGALWLPAGHVTLDLPAGTVAGLAASSHKQDILTKAVFDHVQFSTPTAASVAHSPLKRISQLMSIGWDGTEPRVVHQTTERIEAPNWSPDGKWLVFNSQGALWRIPAAGGVPPERIPTGDVTGVNNDHVLAPDGRTIFFSAQGHLYAVPFAGGPPRRISNDQAPARQFKYFLHGISPDGRTLAYAGVEAAGADPWGRIDLYTIPAAGGPDTRLTDTPAPDDGPEFSPDGRWIYFNSERDAPMPGHAQCYRMAPDGTGIQQLTRDERVNWFPHISPDGQWVVYLSFPPGTLKHPENQAVILRRMRPDGSGQSDIVAFNGGQGTINVNSWSPDSKRFAFVMYPAVSK